jgi:hypothetical protein
MMQKIKSLLILNWSESVALATQTTKELGKLIIFRLVNQW